MTRVLATALGLALLATGPAVGQSGAGDGQAAAGTAGISGVVTDATTGHPIAGAQVRLVGSEPEAIRNRPTVLTDRRGRFVFAGLVSTSRYSLIATHSGYAVGDFSRPDAVAASALVGIDDLPIALDEGEWIRDANISLSRLGSIGGRVVDERDEPAIGVPVRLFEQQLIAGHYRLMPGALVSTDDRGAYRIAAVEPGRYLVAVLSVQATVPVSAVDAERVLPLGGLEPRSARTPPAAASQPRGASIDVDGNHRLILTSFATPPPPGGVRPRAYPPLFHPGGRTLQEAQEVEIAVGTSRGDIDFTLVPVETATVAGRVTGAAGSTDNMLLRLMIRGTEHLGFGSEVATTVVEPGGAFTFLNVPGGDYTLLASPAVAEASSGTSMGRIPKSVGYGSVRSLSKIYPAAPSASFMWWRSEAGAGVWGREQVSVGGADITNLELRMQPAGSVTGRVVFDAPDPVLPAGFTLSLEPADGDPLLGVPNAFVRPEDGSPAFSIAGLQGGRYLLRFFDSRRDWHTTSVTMNGIDVMDQGFDGSLGQAFDDVVLTVSRRETSVTGTVRDEDGRPATGAVIIFPARPERWASYGLTPDRLRSRPAGTDGTFVFEDLLDGEYRIIAVPSGQRDSWLSTDFLEAAAPLASTVTVTSGSPAAVDLRRQQVIVR